MGFRASWWTAALAQSQLHLGLLHADLHGPPAALRHHAGGGRRSISAPTRARCSGASPCPTCARPSSPPAALAFLQSFENYTTTYFAIGAGADLHHLHRQQGPPGRDAGRQRGGVRDRGPHHRGSRGRRSLSPPRGAPEAGSRLGCREARHGPGNGSTARPTGLTGAAAGIPRRIQAGGPTRLLDSSCRQHHRESLDSGVQGRSESFITSHRERPAGAGRRGPGRPQGRAAAARWRPRPP